MSEEELSRLAASVSGRVEVGKRCSLIDVPPERVAEACAHVASLPGYYHLSTITGIDTGEAIELQYHFWKGRAFVTVRARVPKTDPRVPSLRSVLPSSLLYEAEVRDLLGVTFEGNPLMGRKLLLPDNYPPDAPPPLRKEADPEKIRKAMQLE